MDKFFEFINDVKELHPERYGENVKLAVNRHLKDLKKSKKKDFLYKFDEGKAARAINILSKLRHTKGSFAKSLFDIQPHQAFTFGSLFGWVRKDNPDIKRFKKMYKATAKKSGKSEEMAALEIIYAFFNNEIGAEVFTLATKKDQAHHVFKAVRRMCTFMRQESQRMRERIKLRQWDVVDLQTDSFIGRLTADSESEDGASPSMAVIDEYHAHPDSSVMKGMEMGALERQDSLIAIITTAGFNKNYPCYKLQKTVCEPILRGDLENDEFFILIFDLDEDDDPHDERNWYKANPNLGNTPKLDSFRSVYKSAKQEGASEWSSFMTKCLNRWMDTPNVWIKSEEWKGCSDKTLDLDNYKGLDIILGLDLSTRRDISALYVLIPPQSKNDRFLAFPYFFCPEDKIQGVTAVDKVDYRQFLKNNEIIITKGRKGIDYAYIEKVILELKKDYNIVTVAYDPYNSENLIDNIEMKGVDCTKYFQTVAYMHKPTKKLEDLILDKYITHDGNSVMSWMMGNVVMLYDTNGNMKINKAKSINKVDGVSALVTALGGYMVCYADDQVLDVDDLGYLGGENKELDTKDLYE